MPTFPQEQADKVVFSITQNLRGIDVVTYYENQTLYDPIFIETVAFFMRGVEASNIVINSLDIVFLRQPALKATETSIGYTVTIPNTATVGYPSGQVALNSTLSSLQLALRSNAFDAYLQDLATQRQVTAMESVTSNEATVNSVSIESVNSDEEDGSATRFRWGINIIVLISTAGLLVSSWVIYKSIHASGILNSANKENE